jgi:hypothetical protein
MSEDDWFRELFPKAKLEFPPPLKLELCKPVEVILLDNKPRIVRGGMGRKAAIIEVGLGKRTLYLSNQDLARQIRLLQNEVDSLKGVKLRIHWVKKGKYNKYEVKQLKGRGDQKGWFA